jgi:hypothetical protein
MAQHTEAIMQEPIRAGGGTQFRLSNPFLDIVVAGLEAQLKAWQAYQVEGTHFVAKRMRCNLEHMRALGHCGDPQSTSACHSAWLRDLQKDYAEEWGRIAATSFALAFGELSSLGWLFGQRAVKEVAKAEQATAPVNPGKPRSSLPAAA